MDRHLVMRKRHDVVTAVALDDYGHHKLVQSLFAD